MRWVDVAGPPGSGKSSLCYPLWGERSVTWDGHLPPAYWKPFLDEITNLCLLVQDHPSFEAVLRMNDRSAKKMATVERMPATPRYLVNYDTTVDCFVQTGLVQRILGFGWRLHHLNRDVNLIRRALWLMPVSVGVVFLEADTETITARNKARELNPVTAHENRSFQVPHMLPAIAIAKEVLNERGVPVLTLDVQHQSIDAARKQLLDFAHGPTCDAAALRSGCESETVSVPPQWWRS
jgi:hypothetical protein